VARGAFPELMRPLEGLDLAEVSRVLRDMKVDGWLIFDFHGLNPIATRMLGLSGLATRRLFVWLPASGKPVAVAHRIELQPMEAFPGEVRPYAAWQELHAALGSLVKGKRIALEYSPDDAVPYLDRVPAGVVGLLERLGATVVSSAPLVSRFAARWSARELTDHRKAAEIIADIARTALKDVGARAGSVTEYALQREVLQAIERAGLVTTHPPIAAFGPNSANPHYEPAESGSAGLERDQVVLLDLWAGFSRQTVFADQTWMAYSGPTAPSEVVHVWEAVRDARDRAVDRLRQGLKAGQRVNGRDLDAAARGLLVERGYGHAFPHRTGHSIDIDLHGSGPHLDSFETDDDRELVPGIGFSVEPGVYLTGKFGVRSEINVALLDTGPEVTPKVPQRDLWLSR
jgi:Xaa-Pro aminopeptidase